MARSRGSMLAATEGYMLRYLGRWDEAVRVIEEALAVGPPPLYGAYLRALLADIARCRGERARFEELLRGLAEFAMHVRDVVEVLAEIVTLRLAWAYDNGDLDAADRLLGEHIAEAATWPNSERLRFALLGARIQRAVRAAAPRNRRVADAVPARLAELSGLIDTMPSGFVAARAAARTLEAMAGDAMSIWDDAVAAWRALGDRYEVAIVLAGAAAAALAGNNRPGAESRLREARAIAADLGAAPLVAHVDELTARGRLDLGQAPAANDYGLTRRELDVLRVLAQGRSNPQIAKELFISTNTVATHVARILVKLDAATRTEAASRASEAGLIG
jgi:DNA-binding NarL/FixJ family response regulator